MCRNNIEKSMSKKGWKTNVQVFLRFQRLFDVRWVLNMSDNVLYHNKVDNHSFQYFVFGMFCLFVFCLIFCFCSIVFLVVAVLFVCLLLLLSLLLFCVCKLSQRRVLDHFTKYTYRTIYYFGRLLFDFTNEERCSKLLKSNAKECRECALSA